MGGVFTHRLGAFDSGGGAPATDPHFASTVLLLSCDGSNGSTTFTDESAAARGNAGVLGNAQVSTSIVKFGSGSLRLDGNIDGINYADSADWLLSGDFTMETWAYFDSASIETTQTMFSQWTTTGNQRSWSFQYSGAGATNTLNFLGSNAGSAVNLNVSHNWTPTHSTWYMLCAERSGNDFRIYIDGAMVAKTTTAFTFHNSSAGFRAGYLDSGGVTQFLHGNMDEMRITNGVARYASDGGYSVPSSAFPRS